MVGNGEGNRGWLSKRLGLGGKSPAVSEMMDELKASQDAAQAEQAVVKEPAGEQDADIKDQIKILDEPAEVLQVSQQEEGVPGGQEQTAPVEEPAEPAAQESVQNFDTDQHKKDVLTNVQAAMDKQTDQRDRAQTKEPAATDEATTEEPAEAKPSLLEKYADILKDTELSEDELAKLLPILEKVDARIDSAEANLEQKTEVAQQALAEVELADAEVDAAIHPNAVFIELETGAELAEEEGDIETATNNRGIFAKLAKYRRVGGRLTRKVREAGSQRREQQALDRIQQKALSVGTRRKTWFGALRDVAVGLANTAWQPLRASADSLSAVGATGDYLLSRAQGLGVAAKDTLLGAGADVLSNKVAQMIENAGSGELDIDDPFFAAKSALRERGGAGEAKIAALETQVEELREAAEVSEKASQKRHNELMEQNRQFMELLRNQQPGSQSEQQ